VARRSTWRAIRSSCREAPEPAAQRWPRLGEHTDEILASDLALDAADRAALREAGVIG
jgi:crotonobetainyl-CoA:carnitine CoA-transferase CaiB-like acyl-CoA transferase